MTVALLPLLRAAETPNVTVIASIAGLANQRYVNLFHFFRYSFPFFCSNTQASSFASSSISSYLSFALSFHSHSFPLLVSRPVDSIPSAVPIVAQPSVLAGQIYQLASVQVNTKEACTSPST